VRSAAWPGERGSRARGARRPPDAHGPPRPAVAAYLARVREAAAEDPRLLVAHAFTQHLALLAGGQFIAKTVRRQLALPAGAGTAAYHFAVRAPPGRPAGSQAAGRPAALRGGGAHARAGGPARPGAAVQGGRGRAHVPAGRGRRAQGSGPRGRARRGADTPPSVPTLKRCRRCWRSMCARSSSTTPSYAPSLWATAPPCVRRPGDWFSVLKQGRGRPHSHPLTARSHAQVHCFGRPARGRRRGSACLRAAGCAPAARLGPGRRLVGRAVNRPMCTGPVCHASVANAHRRYRQPQKHVACSCIPSHHACQGSGERPCSQTTLCMYTRQQADRKPTHDTVSCKVCTPCTAHSACAAQQCLVRSHRTPGHCVVLFKEPSRPRRPARAARATPDCAGRLRCTVPASRASTRHTSSNTDLDRHDKRAGVRALPLLPASRQQQARPARVRRREIPNLSGPS